jgi:glycosyltransferase involved in cell wall biosynthesis
VLVAGGDGGERGYADRLRRRAAELGLAGTVRFLGYVPEAGRHCGEFDVQVVPSWAESFGLVTLEALARGVPVVATTAGGSPEIVRDGREGLLVPPGDPAALADRVDRLLASAELRRALGEAGRERVESRFSLDRMVEATAEVYAGVLADRPVARRAGA